MKLTYAVVSFDYKSTNSEEWQNIKRFPAISFLSKNVTIDGVKGCNVVTADFSISSGMYVAGPDQCDSVVYASFADGIQYINRFQTGAKLENVTLPASLKVLEKSFWNMRNLKSLELPEGLEIIIDSLWGDYMEGMVGYYRGASAFPFTVNIPASVNTLVTVPSNLKFAEGSEYYYEEGELFRNRTIDGVTYKTLVCTYQDKIADETLTVAEGVEAVSVGAFKGLNVKYISLPSTFKKISYTLDENNATYELSYYTGSMLTDMQRVQAPDEKSAIDSYSVFSGLTSNDFGYVYLNVASMPEGISEYAFTQGKTPYTELTESDGTTLEKVVCIGAIKRNKAVIIHIVCEDTRDSSTKRTYSITGKKSAGTLTMDEILEAIGINDGSYSYEINELGKPYTPGTLDHNLYLRVTYTRNILGVTYTKDDATKTITVTGFDKNTAFDLGGVYRICIKFDDETLKTYKVVIADNAFKDNNYISEVYVGSQVTSIGAGAFANTSNLTKFIISDGGLEEVKTRAFENAGCIVNGATVTINENIKKSGIKFVLPLAKMKNIEPYAFKTKAIFGFTETETEGNEDNPRKLTEESEFGEYYFIKGRYETAYGIIKLVDNTKTKVMSDNNNNDMTVKIYDVQYVATAGGYTGAGHMGIGFSERNYGCLYADLIPQFAAYRYYVYRFEVMEGSVYYLGNGFNYISFGIFSKIHRNAFTDMEPYYVNLFYRMMSFMPNQYCFEVDTTGFDGEVESSYYPETYKAKKYVDYSVEFHTDDYKVYSVIDLGTNFKREFGIMYSVSGFMEVAGGMGSGVQILYMDYDHIIKLSDENVDYKELSGDSYSFESSGSFYPGNSSDLNDKNLTYDETLKNGLSTKMINFWYSASSENAPYAARKVYNSKITFRPTDETNSKNVSEARYEIAHFDIQTNIYGYDAETSRKNGEELYYDSMSVQTFGANGMRESSKFRLGKTFNQGDVIRLEDIYREKVSKDTDFSTVRYKGFALSGDKIDFSKEITVNKAFTFSSDCAIVFTFTDDDGITKTAIVELVEKSNPDYRITDENHDWKWSEDDNAYVSDTIDKEGASVELPTLTYSWTGVKNVRFRSNWYDDESCINPLHVGIFTNMNGVYSLTYIGHQKKDFTASAYETYVCYELVNAYGETEFVRFKYVTSQKETYRIESDNGEIMDEGDVKYDEYGKIKDVKASESIYLTKDNCDEKLSRSFSMIIGDDTPSRMSLTGFSAFLVDKNNRSTTISRDIGSGDIDSVIKEIKG